MEFVESLVATSPPYRELPLKSESVVTHNFGRISASVAHNIVAVQIHSYPHSLRTLRSLRSSPLKRDSAFG